MLKLFLKYNGIALFEKYFVRKNSQGGGELLLKNGALDGHPYYTCYSWAGFTLRVLLGTLGIFATSSCQI